MGVSGLLGGVESIAFRLILHQYPPNTLPTKAYPQQVSSCDEAIGC